MEVRCCCDTRLLGWMDVPPGSTEMHFNIPIARGSVHDAIDAPSDDKAPFSTRIVLTVERLYDRGEKKFAVKSKDYPIELLERVPGFERYWPLRLREWLPFDQAMASLRQHQMINGSMRALEDWSLKYIDARVDMRTGQVYLSPGDEIRRVP
jgi:hypothetical protein